MRIVLGGDTTLGGDRQQRLGPFKLSASRHQQRENSVSAEASGQQPPGSYVRRRVPLVGSMGDAVGYSPPPGSARVRLSAEASGSGSRQAAARLVLAKRMANEVLHVLLWSSPCSRCEKLE